jgi:hypothetical protein
MSGKQKTESKCVRGQLSDSPISRYPLTGLALHHLQHGSILVFRLIRQFMNSDAFFTFSAMEVHFGQVTGRANPLAGRASILGIE